MYTYTLLVVSLSVILSGDVIEQFLVSVRHTRRRKIKTMTLLLLTTASRRCSRISMIQDRLLHVRMGLHLSRITCG